MQKNPIHRAICAFLCCALCMGVLCVPAGALGNRITPDAPVYAGSAVLIEAKGGCVLYEQHAHTRMPMASTTKIMTALVVLERCDLQATVCIDARAVGTEGSSVYLYPEECLTVEQLLYALMLSSANDAAAALAYEVAGSIEGFAALMNQKAQELGLVNTHFANPHGLDAQGHYTTAYDLACIAAYALENPDFLRIVSSEKKVIPLREQEGARVLRNHNKLLASYQGCIGVKTGFTKKSGRCLVSAAERDGVRLVCVTLDCPDDWRTHTALLDSGFAALERVSLTRANAYVTALPVVGGTQTQLYLQTDSSVSVTLPRERGEIRCHIESAHFLYAPIAQGAHVGDAVWTLDGEEIARAPLFATYGVEKLITKRTPLAWLRVLLNKLKEIL